MDELEPCSLERSDDGQPLLVWRLRAPRLSISSSPLGGGIGLRGWVLNAQVPKRYGRTDPATHLRELATDRGLAGAGVGLLTAATVAERQHAGDDLRADVTVGVTLPVWAAARTDDPDREVARPGQPGTVNAVVQLPVRLAPSALVNAVLTATEAKTQAFLEHGLPGTGTASDAVCVLCPAEGDEEQFAGPRAPWGARLATAVHDAVASGITCWQAGAPS